MVTVTGYSLDVIYIHTHAHTHACTHAHTHTRTHAHTHTRTHKVEYQTAQRVIDKCKYHIQFSILTSPWFPWPHSPPYVKTLKWYNIITHFTITRQYTSMLQNNVRKSISMSNIVYPEYLRRSIDDIYTDIFFKTLLNSEDCCSSSSSYSMNHTLCLHWGFKGCVTAIFAMAYPTQRL